VEPATWISNDVSYLIISGFKKANQKENIIATRGFFGNPIVAVSVLLAYVMICRRVRLYEGYFNWVMIVGCWVVRLVRVGFATQLNSKLIPSVGWTP
jgi:hypothetical protein